jgi:hypothetical protein
MEREARKVLVSTGAESRGTSFRRNGDTANVRPSRGEVLAQIREAERSAERIIQRLDEIHELVQRTLAREHGDGP